MKFGMMVFPHPGLASAQAKFAEERDFSHVWFADLPMVCADVYACMALAATATRKIKLGTSVAVAPMRAAPVTVNSIATINALAPGRVVLGFASGSFTRGQLGLPPIRFREFREHVRTIRSLLDRGEALYEADGKPTKIRYFNRDWGSIALSPPIPLYLGAAGPKAAALAGEFGEGLLAGATPIVEILGPLIAAVRDGARRVGRSMDDFFFSLEGPICILRSGEALDSERIVATAGPVVVLVLKFMAESHVPAQALPPGIRSSYEALLSHLQQVRGPVDERHLEQSEGVFTARSDELRFVTPEAIRALTLAGPLEEVLERLQALEAIGFSNFVVWTPREGIEAYVRDLDRVRERF